MLVVAYIGFGNSVNRYHLPYVRRREDRIKVKYIFRRQIDRDSDFRFLEEWYPDITFTNDLNVVLNDPEVNLVVVNTPDEFHVEYTRKIIEAGKNCLCEKPFAMTVKEAKEMFDLAKEKGVIVTANQNRRFDADMRTVRKVLESGVLGDLVEVESHYDYYRPSIKDFKRMGILYGLAVHPLDQIIGQFGIPKKVVADCRSIDNPGISDDYYDFDLFYDNGLKCIVKTSYYVKLDYPSFIVHGKKGSFLMPAMPHQSNLKPKPGPTEISFEPLPEEFWGTLCYVDEEGNDVLMKVPAEIQDYGMIYDNLYDVILNGKEKLVKDEEVLEVLRIVEEGMRIAKEAR